MDAPAAGRPSFEGDRTGTAVAVAASARHGFVKKPWSTIELIAGEGVQGDAHSGATVQHLIDKRRDPKRPNRRQVHLIEAGLLRELRGRGFTIGAGELGENILVEGIALTELATGTRLHVGSSAILELTGLREPCVKIERFAAGLRAALTEDRDGFRFTKRSVMAIVVTSGRVSSGDPINIETGPVHATLRLV
jgi:MOSC domain-containing protein YiiM